MSLGLTLLAVCASTAGLALAAADDPKRRRTHGLPPPEGRRRAAAVALIATPGIGLAALADAAGFAIWLGAVSVVGWAVAASTPAQVAAARQAVAAASARAVERLRAAVAAAPTASRLDALDRRVAALEARHAEGAARGAADARLP